MPECNRKAWWTAGGEAPWNYFEVGDEVRPLRLQVQFLFPK
jgi:hypothetical protein